MTALLQIQLSHQFFQLPAQRALARNQKPGFWKCFCESGERKQSRCQALSLAPIGKPEPLSTRHRPGPFLTRYGNPSKGIPVRFSRIFCGSQSSSINRSAIDRLRTRTSGTNAKQFPEIGLVSAFGFPALNVHSMKRNDARTIPSFDKRKQMDPGISEVDMHQIRVPSQQHAPDYFEFAAIHQSGSPRHILQASAAERD